MAFLTIDGITVPVEYKNVSRKTGLSNGNMAFSGRPIRREVGITEEISFVTPPISQAEAHSLMGLLSHRGHYFSFSSDVWSDRGLGPADRVNPPESGPRPRSDHTSDENEK